MARAVVYPTPYGEPFTIENRSRKFRYAEDAAVYAQRVAKRSLTCCYIVCGKEDIAVVWLSGQIDTTWLGAQYL